MKVVNSRLMLRIFLRLACCALIGVGFAPPAAVAQLVASRDITLGWRVPSERLSIPESCTNPHSSMTDGQVPDGAPKTKDLEVTIVETSPAKLEIGGDFDATVRLKNVGTQPVLVPSATDGERVLHPSADGTEEKYEVGDISFRLMTGKHSGVPVYLNSSGALFADPDDKSSYLSLAPGKWLDIKLHARVECGLERCVGDLMPDNQAALTAWWYQRVLTHRVSGCEETHGSHPVREVDSAPFTIVVQNPGERHAAVAFRF
ncbi:MAG: hypothetical protein J2P13_07890 [Acidobacteria bacterium]|nr:hypothetical protein [Acidobacteriota bacterium]